MDHILLSSKYTASKYCICSMNWTINSPPLRFHTRWSCTWISSDVYNIYHHVWSLHWRDGMVLSKFFQTINFILGKTPNKRRLISLISHSRCTEGKTKIIKRKEAWKKLQYWESIGNINIQSATTTHLNKWFVLNLPHIKIYAHFSSRHMSQIRQNIHILWVYFLCNGAGNLMSYYIKKN